MNKISMILLLGFAVLSGSLVRAESMSVTVVQNAEQYILVTKGGDSMKLYTPKKKRWLVRGLAKGDEVSVSYERDGEKNYVTEVRGEGTVKGKVVAVDKVTITVETEAGVTHKLMPPWRGGMPKDGGGHLKEVLEQIHALEPGQTVIMKWKIEEGKRVINVKPVV